MRADESLAYTKLGTLRTRCRKNRASLDLLFFAVIDRNVFEMTKNLSHFGQNVWKYKITNTVTASFDTTVRQMTEMPHRKKRFEWRIFAQFIVLAAMQGTVTPCGEWSVKSSQKSFLLFYMICVPHVAAIADVSKVNGSKEHEMVAA